MIERYTTKEMKTIWDNNHKYQAWLKVELSVLNVYMKKGIITKETYDTIKENAKINTKRIDEIEATTHHDVIAFTRQISETLGEEKKWFHYGLTSTDIVDTANALLLKEANILIEKEFWGLINTLKEKALKYKNTPCIGRTHGIHAEITSFGLKWALWYDEALRNLKRFRMARLEIERGKISGAVGNFANINPEIEKMVCINLGIDYAKISSQVISRDYHINYLNSLTLIASLLEKIATEIRHLSRSEIKEVEEFFADNQKGSSAMPHKRNPIASENICGLSRIMRGYLLSTYENNPLWHERDISHSSVERIVLPDATTLIHYMLKRYKKVLDNLIIYPDAMLKNIDLTNNVIYSGRIVSLLIERGLTREEGYDLVQRIAFISFENNLDFKLELLKSDIKHYLSVDDINKAFNYDYYLQNVDQIFARLNLEEKYE